MTVVRRLLAALVVFTLALGCVEPLMDGARGGADATASVSQAPRGPTDQGSDRGPQHEIHLCPCTHAVGASRRAIVEIVSVVVSLDESAGWPALLAPTSVSLAGPSRPPAPATIG